MDFILLVPSRGRPQNIERLKKDVWPEISRWERGHPHTQLIVGLDEDDAYNYPEHDSTFFGLGLSYVVGPRLRLGGTLNALARQYSEYDILGFLGDDHQPKGNWCQRVADELTAMRVGMVYGDDGHQGANLPTAIFMTSNIIRTLGYMVPPGLTHLYIDDAWLALGKAANCIRYLPDVKITHLHPNAMPGKVAWDDRYEEVNSQAQYDADAAAFNAWKQNGFAIDVEKLIKLKESV